MRFHVAIKIPNYTAQFSFETEEEREEFIQITRESHPNVEVVCSEEDGGVHAKMPEIATA